MTKHTYFLLFFISILWVGLSKPMIYDNRFFPLQDLVPIYIKDKPSYLIVSPFFTTASSAFNKNQDEVGIPELFGPLDVTKLGESLEQVGLPNPLPAFLRIGSNPFFLDGKIQSQGVAFIFRKAITDWLQCGFSTLFMNARSRQEFFFNVDPLKGGSSRQLEPGTLQTIEQARREMLALLRLRQNESEQFGMGDFDAYVRFTNAWEYLYKFRRIEAGFSVGGLFPSGKSIDIFEPTSVPLGGNGHWGVYAAVDAEFEIKEDWNVGLLFRLNKRFAKTKCLRLATCLTETNSGDNNEVVKASTPFIFGTVVGDFRVNPGPTFVFSPYVSFQNLRDGFGVGVQYVLTTHREDSVTDKRCDQSIAVNIDEFEELSVWGSDYVGLSAFYDFGKMKVERGYAPILSLQWDVPMAVFIADRVPKTHRVSLGIQFNF